MKQAKFVFKIDISNFEPHKSSLVNALCPSNNIIQSIENHSENNISINISYTFKETQKTNDFSKKMKNIFMTLHKSKILKSKSFTPTFAFRVISQEWNQLLDEKTKGKIKQVVRRNIDNFKSKKIKKGWYENTFTGALSFVEGILNLLSIFS